MTPKDRVLAYLDAFSSGDPDAVIAHVTKDFQNNQMPALGTGCKGREVYRGRLKNYLAGFQKLKYTPESFVIDGNAVAVAYCMTAEDKGHPIEIHGVMMITFVDGLICSRSDYWDGLTYLNQIGEGLK